MMVDGCSMIAGGPAIVNDSLLEPVPADVSTEIGPLNAPTGTVTKSCVEDSPMLAITGTPPKRTTGGASPRASAVPLMRTRVPGAPLPGEKLATVGGGADVTV